LEMLPHSHFASQLVVDFVRGDIIVEGHCDVDAGWARTLKYFAAESRRHFGLGSLRDFKMPGIELKNFLVDPNI
jgi:hypothetical protein